jgi:cobaltochelatase CobS
MACADLLQLACYSISVNEQTSKSDFLGYVDATGNIVKTNFRKAYEEGGVFIIDEVDAGNPNILTVINSALSNKMCPFPDGMVQRHNDFVCICTANTFGEGESLQYIGRNILDSATRDRFATVFVNYSDAIEAVLIPTYSALVKKLRALFTAKNAQIVVSTRAGLRLERLKQAKKSLTEQDIVACLNLHTEVTKDKNVLDLVRQYVG